MQNTAVAGGATDVSVILRAFDTTTGAAKTDVTDATSGLELRYKRGATGSVTTVSPASQTSTGAHTDGGIVHLHGGLYRLDLPDAAFATGVPWVVVSAAGVADCVFTAAFVEIMGSDPRAAAISTADVADAVLDEAMSGHTSAGSFGKAVADILEDTATTLPATLTTIDTEVGVIDGLVDAIKAKTDALTFTVSGQVDANVQSINDTALQGNGTSGTPWAPV